MAFHHIARGEADGLAQVATLWVVCNSEVSLAPTIEGNVCNYVNSDLYDDLFVLEDKETKTLCSHMTGEALYGKHAGLQMPVSNLLQINAEQALALDPTMKIAISERPYNEGERSMAARWSPDRDGVQLMPELVETLADEDIHLNRMAIGLGIQSDDGMRRCYPVSAIRTKGRDLTDQVEGKQLLVFLGPFTSTPTAIYWDTDEFSISRGEINLSNGFKISNGQLFDSTDVPVAAQMPKHMYSRWQGFALTFPGPETVQ